HGEDGVREPHQGEMVSSGTRTVIDPSAWRSSRGPNSPTSSRFHQSPVRARSARVVNQYSYFTTRMYRGGRPAKGSLRKSASTLGSFWRTLALVSTRNPHSSQTRSSEQNQRFQSKRGWYGA